MARRRAMTHTGKVSMAKFNAMSRKVALAQKKAKKIRAVADEKVEHIVRSSEVFMGAAVAGVARGKYGKKEISGVPMELLIGGGLHLAGLFGVGGDMKSHLHAFGDGMLAVFAADVGESVGKKGFAGLKETFGPSTVKGALYDGGNLSGQRLTEEELDLLSR